MYCFRFREKIAVIDARVMNSLSIIPKVVKKSILSRNFRLTKYKIDIKIKRMKCVS